MGGCASKPKEFDTPVESPINPEKPQLEAAAQDNTNGGESQIEKPLVDVSEPEKEAQGSSSEPKAAASEPVTTAETAKPIEDDVKADNTAVLPVKEAEADQNSNAAQTKEEVKADNTAVLPVKEAEAEADQNSNAAQSKEEVKSDGPPVSL